jgi:hypothetical protein
MELEIEGFWIQICTWMTGLMYLDNYCCSGNSSLFRIKLVTLCIIERISLPPALIRSAGSLSIPGHLCLFSSSIDILTRQHWSQALAALSIVINPI